MWCSVVEGSSRTLPVGEAACTIWEFPCWLPCRRRESSPTHRVSAPSDGYGSVVSWGPSLAAWSSSMSATTLRETSCSIAGFERRTSACRPTQGFPIWSPNVVNLLWPLVASPGSLPVSTNGSGGRLKRQPHFSTAWGPNHLRSWTWSCSFHQQTWHSHGRSRTACSRCHNSLSRLTHWPCCISAVLPVWRLRADIIWLRRRLLHGLPS